MPSELNVKVLHEIYAEFTTKVVIETVHSVFNSPHAVLDSDPIVKVVALEEPHRLV